MRPKLKITGLGTFEEIKEALHQEFDVKRRRKLQTIRLGFSGDYSTDEIAQIVGCMSPVD